MELEDLRKQAEAQHQEVKKCLKDVSEQVVLLRIETVQMQTKDACVQVQARLHEKIASVSGLNLLKIIGGVIAALGGSATLILLLR